MVQVNNLHTPDHNAVQIQWQNPNTNAVCGCKKYNNAIYAWESKCNS